MSASVGCLRSIAIAVLWCGWAVAWADEETSSVVFALALSASTGEAFGVESPSIFRGTVRVASEDVQPGRSAPLRDFRLTVGDATWTLADQPDTARLHFPADAPATLGLSVRNADGHQLVITGDSQWLAQAAGADSFLLGYTGTVQVIRLDPAQ